MVIIYFAALILGKYLLHLGSSSSAILALSSAFPAAPFFGPAILGGLFGSAGASVPTAAIAIFANLILLPITIVILESAKASQQHIGRAPVIATGSLRISKVTTKENGATIPQSSVRAKLIEHSFVQAVKAPDVWAPIVGFVVVLLGVLVPSLIQSSLNEIGNTASGVALFVSGLVLAAHSLKLNPAVLLNTAMKSVVMPVVMLGIVLALGIHGNPASEAVIAATLTSGPIASILAVRYGAYQSEAGSTLLLTSFLILITIPLPVRC